MNEKISNWFIIILFCLLLCCAGTGIYLWYTARSTTELYSEIERQYTSLEKGYIELAEERNHYISENRRLESENRDLRKTITELYNFVGELGTELEGIEGTGREIQATLDKDRELIEECENLIGKIREEVKGYAIGAGDRNTGNCYCLFNCWYYNWEGGK